MTAGGRHQDPNKTRWMRLWRLVQDYLPRIVTGAAAIGIVVVGFMANLRNVPLRQLLHEPLFIVFLILVGIQVLGSVYVTVRGRRWSRLYAENQALASENQRQADLLAGFEEVRYEANSMLLRAAADELDLGDRARISYYEPYSARFILKGRYATNSRYAKKSAKKYLSKDTVIGRCFDKGDESFNLPNPTANWPNYLIAQAELGLSEADVTALTMKARTYWTKGVAGVDGRGLVGVIVLEHEGPNAFSGNAPYAAIEPVAKMIGQLKNTMGGFAPDSSKASRSDF